MAVVQAMATIINTTTRLRPYDFLYFESDFSDQPARRELHGESGSHRSSAA